MYENGEADCTVIQHSQPFFCPWNKTISDSIALFYNADFWPTTFTRNSTSNLILTLYIKPSYKSVLLAKNIADYNRLQYCSQLEDEVVFFMDSSCIFCNSSPLSSAELNSACTAQLTHTRTSQILQKSYLSLKNKSLIIRQFFWGLLFPLFPIYVFDCVYDCLFPNIPSITRNGWKLHIKCLVTADRPDD